MDRCERCDSEVEHLNQTRTGARMCDYCYKSYVGIWVECGNKNAEIGKMIAQCFNVLEQKLMKKRKAK